MLQDYTRADKQLHWLSQIIAKANRTYVPAREDDSHTNLSYHHGVKQIRGRWFESKTGRLIFIYNLENQQIEILNRYFETVAIFNTIGNSYNQLQKEIERALPALGLDPTGFLDDLHFQIPDYCFSEQPIQEIPADAIRAWTHFRQLANDACELLTDDFQQAVVPRIWPHHFDTRVYFEPDNKLGLGFGLAMEDGLLDMPYFYFSAYGLNGNDVDYSGFAPLQSGKWINENWKGAVLGIHEVKSKQDLINFKQEVLKVYLNN